MPARSTPRPRGRTTRRPGPAALAAAVAFVVLAILVTGSPARAQTTTPTPVTPAPNSTAQNPGGSNRWGFTPTGPDRAVPGPRNDFTYQVAPGASLDDSVTVWNYSDVPANFMLYATDALDTADGAFDLLPRDQAPREAGTWVKVAQGSVIVPARSAMTVPFTVTVPADASPGDHAGGLVASIEAPGTDPSGSAVTVDTRFGLPAYIQVAGPLSPALVVENLQSHYSRSPLSIGGGDLDVSWTVRNTGNVRLGAHQRLEAEAPFGFALGSQDPDDVPELLPGGSVSYTAHLSGVLPTFRVTSVVTLDPFSRAGDLDPAPPKASASSSVWAIPWLLLIAVGALVAVIVWRRRRARRRPATAAPLAAPPTAVSTGAR